MKQKTPLGAHLSVAGGYYKALERAAEIDSTALQIFTKSNRTWFAQHDITTEDATKFKQAVQKHAFNPYHIAVHSAYLINIASPKKDIRAKSLKSLIQEMLRCDALGIPYLVLHPGAHLGAGEEEGIKNIARELETAYQETNSSVSILLETAAGQGTTLGDTFEQIAQIRNACRVSEKIGVCLDTCHIFSAGYDISTPSKLRNVITQFDQVIGLNLLKIIHLNNSKTSCKSRVDRHEKINRGTIPVDVFKAIMHDTSLAHIPKILETPIDEDWEKEYQEEIALLRSL